MALTDHQKYELDRMIEGKIKSLIGQTFELKDFAQDCADINVPFNANSVYAALTRRMRIHTEFTFIAKKIKKDNRTITVWTILAPTTDLLFTGDNTFTKKKNILTFACNKKLTYDFITNKFSFDFYNEKCITIDTGYNYLIRETKTIIEMLKYEWLFNYCNDLSMIAYIHDFCTEDMYKAMPKDFIKNFGNKITAENLREAYYLAKYGKFYKIAKELYNYCGPANMKIIEFLFNNNGGFGTYITLVKNSILNGILSDYKRECRTLANIYWEVVQNKQIPFTLDLNRDFHYNCKQLQAIVDKEKNEEMARKLQRLNFINGMIFGEYIVVVPQNVEEKADEGKQQNNCVGHYYDDSILGGYNLIYFLRKVANPKKSYMTCRYNLQCSTTVEYRLKNNESVHDYREIAIIHQIDKIIKANLK